jgi:hypothetical protein
VAPTVSTVLLTVLVPTALVFGGFSAMATDSCGPDDCSSALMTWLDVIFGTFAAGVVVTPGACIAAWVLPWRRRWAAARVCLALLALAPPLLVLFLVVTLPQP